MRKGIGQINLIPVSFNQLLGETSQAVIRNPEDTMRTTLLSSLIPLSLLSACGSQVISIEGQSDDGLAVHAAAVTLVQERGAALGLDHNDSVRQRTAFVDELGQEHVRFDRSYRGLPVIGGDFIVHPGAAEEEQFSAQLLLPIPVSNVPTLNAAQAGRIAERAFSGERTGAAESRLVIYAVEGPAALAYESITSGVATDGTPSLLHTFVDANSGRILSSYDEIETAGTTGTGKGIHSGTVTLNVNKNGANYELVDTLHASGQTVDMTGGTSKLFTSTTNVWGDGTKANKQSAAVDAHYGNQNIDEPAGPGTEDDYNTWNIGTTFAMHGFEIDLRYHDTDIDAGDDIEAYTYGESSYDSAFVVKIGREL